MLQGTQTRRPRQVESFENRINVIRCRTIRIRPPQEGSPGKRDDLSLELLINDPPRTAMLLTLEPRQLLKDADYLLDCTSQG